MRICFVSNNINKIKEIHELPGISADIIGLRDLNIEEDIPETGQTLEENSRIKARYVSARYSIPVFADDSGLFVEALNGEPGVYSARYAGPERDSERNIGLLLRKLERVQNRKARFETVITLIEENGNEFQFKGNVHGTIIKNRRGFGGFGYDPVFIPDGYNLTFAEMKSEEKNKISHRFQAVQKLAAHLQKSK